MSETITRDCSICGAELEIDVVDDGTYSGGNYMGTVSLPADDAEIIDEYQKDVAEDFEEMDSMVVDIVEYSEYDDVEMWECNSCYENPA